MDGDDVFLAFQQFCLVRANAVCLPVGRLCFRVFHSNLGALSPEASYTMMHEHERWPGLWAESRWQVAGSPEICCRDPITVRLINVIPARQTYLWQMVLPASSRCWGGWLPGRNTSRSQYI